MVLSSIPLILTSVALNAVAQLLLKQGMLSVARFEQDLAGLTALLPRAALNPFVIGGVGCYVLSFWLWLLVLARVEVSAAYPFLSIGFVIAAIAGYLLLNESLGLERILGIALICGGVILISRS